MAQVSVKLQSVLAESSAARRERPRAIIELEKALAEHGQEQIIDRVAYIWFNRFCALRFMDVNRYTSIGVVSPAAGQFQPEILAEAKMGHIYEDMVLESTRRQVFALLEGQAPSRDPQGEAYRLLLVSVCNHWNKAMPFLFQHIDDYTELLMPDDLLSGNSIVSYIREAMTPDVCENVEIIGWLYQFYIAEKKDAVFEGLKKNMKITPENIPAVTQLFTPHWIVRYLVENSLGRLWLLNRPKSGLAGRMDYYIKPEQPETDFLRVNKPEEIKICDPACGSGHMLTYAFDLLFAIYEEEGYDPAEIPEKILAHNLYGLEIDGRAGALAAFALAMKARAKQRGFFRKPAPVKPNICVLQKIAFNETELANYMDFAGHDLFTAPLLAGLRQFEEADNFGALIRPEITDAAGMRKILEAKKVGENVLLAHTHPKVLRVLEQSEYLSPRYHVVIANPPYMGGKGMNNRLGAWTKDNYPNSKSDLFAMFIERNLELVQPRGLMAMITMHSWMFLSSFETLRAKLAGQNTILSMAHLGARAFDSIGGEVVSTTAFVITNASQPEYKGGYLRLVDGKSEEAKISSLLEAIRNPQCGWFFRASAADFMKIPGSPIAYWIKETVISIFLSAKSLNMIGKTRRGLQTGNAERFIRSWYEVSMDRISWIRKNKKVVACNFKWFLFNSGGAFRKWYGNVEDVVNWENNGAEIKATRKAIIPSESLYFKHAITWPKVSSGLCSFRWFPDGIIPGDAGPCFYVKSAYQDTALCFLNSKVALSFLQFLSPTLNFEVGVMAKIPIIIPNKKATYITHYDFINIHKTDWDSYETSWDFSTFTLLQLEYHSKTLLETYTAIRTHWRSITIEMKRLEEENNRIFIDAYDMIDELTPEVPLTEITLTCNPYYRYGGDKTEEELEALLLADTMKEFISYAVGCMFGRYALEKPGLILANQGETLEDYLKQVPKPSFPPDKDNVIPILESDWFADDVTERFRHFLRLTFGEERYEENLAFIEQALGKSLRKYFIKDFYNDHVKRYKKRPIYWLFSSPKGSFNALIYMHRYRPDTVGVVLNDYLREFRSKLEAERKRFEEIKITADSPQSAQAKATKALENIKKILHELLDYERNTLYPLATQKLEIDLDDGVKANYPKFRDALKKIPGLEATEE